jgi:hypothetical protein
MASSVHHVLAAQYTAVVERPELVPVGEEEDRVRLGGALVRSASDREPLLEDSGRAEVVDLKDLNVYLKS